MSGRADADDDADDAYVGIDIGGTGTRIVALDATGTLLGQLSVPTPGSRSADPFEVVSRLAGLVRTAAGGRSVASVGIGASGPVDASGVIRNDATLPAFSHLPLTAMLGDLLQVACLIENDAVTAAIGENAYGAGNRSPSLLMVTLGTGIGVAHICGGNTPYRGSDGSHPEAGHIAVPGPPARCYCGLEICWEQLASRTALDALTEHDTPTLAARAREEEPAAIEVFTAYGRRVGAGVATLLTVLRPARVVIGGSASQYLDLFGPAYDAALLRARPFEWTPPTVAAALGDLSGAVGAALLAPTPVRSPRLPATTRAGAAGPTR